MTPEEYGEYLFGIQRSISAREWALRDACLELVQNHDEAFIRATAQAWGTSHRWIKSLAAVAKHFPPDKRTETESVRTHVKWMRRDSALLSQEEAK